MTKPTPGRIVLVLVRPDDNNGHDVMPALVTGVNDDGTVNAIGSPDVAGQAFVDLRGIQLCSDRAAAERKLGQYVEHLPVPKDGPKPTAIDVAPWVKVAYWPTREREPDADPEAKQPSEPAPPSYAELEAQLAQLRADVARSEASAGAPGADTPKG